VQCLLDHLNHIYQDIPPFVVEVNACRSRLYVPGWIRSRSLWVVLVSQLFPPNILHIMYALMYAVYAGSFRLYLPGYTASQSLLLLHEVSGWML